MKTRGPSKIPYEIDPHVFLPFRYPPYSESNISWLSLLLKKRNFPIPDNFGSVLAKLFWLSLGAASVVGYKMAARKYGLEIPSCLQ